MRLIDVDVAVQNTHKEIFWTESQRASMQNFLFHQPTIDPERLRPKGRWVWDEENGCWICSNCKMAALNNWRGNSTDSNYCPNCGAKMEE